MLTLHEHEADYRQSTLRHDIAQVRFIVATTTLAILLANLGDLWLAGFDADALSRLWLFGWQGTLTLMVLLILPNITRWAVFDWVFLGWTLSYFLIALYFRAIAVPVVNAATIALLAFGTYTLFPHRIEFRAVPALVLTAGDLWILGALHGAGRADLVATGLAYLFLHLTGGWVATARETDRRRRYLAQLAQDEASRELERLANLDALTGTLSRRRWLELAEAEFGRFRRHRRPFAVLLVDLDFFKQVNDRHGHPVGDLVLRRFAELLQRERRRFDLVGRLGGEEFGILLPETELPGAAEVAERIVAHCREMTVPTAADPVRVTCSVGVVVTEAGDSTLTEMLARADEAMYAAKRGGRDRVIAAAG